MKMVFAIPMLVLGVFATCAGRGAHAQQLDAKQAAKQAGKQASLRLDAIGYPLEMAAPPGAATIAAGVLTLTAAKGTDLYANVDGSKVVDDTPRVLFEPQGDFIFSAKVSGAFNTKFDGGALIVYAGKSSWAKLLFERTVDGKGAIATTVTKGAGDDALHQMVEGDAVHLKIARRDALYVFYTSVDGLTWRMVRTFGMAGASPIRIGFSSQSPAGPGVLVRYADVRFRTAAFKDYWQGE